MPEGGRDAASVTLGGVALGIATVWLLGAAVGCTSATTPSSGYVRPGDAAGYRTAAVSPADFESAVAEAVEARMRRQAEQGGPAAAAATPATPPTPAAADTVPPPPAAVLEGASQPAATPATTTVAATSEPKPGQAVAFTHGSASDTVPTGVRVEASPASGGSPSAFALYGQIGEAADASFTSPMDAQDNLRRVTFTTEGADFDVEVEAGGEHLYFASTRHRETADLYRQKIGGDRKSVV